MEESTAVRLKPWKGQLLLNVTGNTVGETESVGESLGSSVPAPKPSGDVSQALDI